MPNKIKDYAGIVGNKQYTGSRPYVGSNGNLYTCLRDNTLFWMYRSTDGGSTWTQFAQAPFPEAISNDDGSVTNSTQALVSEVQGEVIHFGCLQRDTSGNTPAHDLHYTTFDMSSEAWGALDTFLSWTPGGLFETDLTIRSDGIVVVAYCKTVKVGGTNYEHVYYARRATDGTWTVDQNLAPNGEANWECPMTEAHGDVIDAMYVDSAGTATSGRGYYVQIDTSWNKTTPSAEIFDASFADDFIFKGRHLDEAGSDILVPYRENAVTNTGSDSDISWWSWSSVNDLWSIATGHFGEAAALHADHNVGGWFFFGDSGPNTTDDPIKYYKWGGTSEGWITESGWVWTTLSDPEGQHVFYISVTKVAELKLGVVYQTQSGDAQADPRVTVWYHEIDVPSQSTTTTTKGLRLFNRDDIGVTS